MISGCKIFACRGYVVQCKRNSNPMRKLASFTKWHSTDLLVYIAIQDFGLIVAVFSQYKDNNESYYRDANEIEDEVICEINTQSEVDGDRLLISLVQSHPYLYNKELSDFKDALKKENAWIEIAKILNMKMGECQTRWTRLRERYTREKKQKQEESTTGSGASRRKTFEFFDNMKFLEPFIKKRRTMTNIR
ncbi:PREDICTED: transcription factor Adf-1-like, partial [Wasmannia auropunctata]|uniref:transcription factor Adf-1-like n=1 Tax=Wasmannia auropunctata TaxID=64793 RepID=UPI0005EDE8FD